MCVCVRLYVCSSLCEKAFEWVLCCLDVASVVNSLSRCSVLSQVPRVYEREREYVCVRLYVCSCLCEKALEWVLCCLDVASVVNSPSRCSVLSQVPRVYEKERERECVCVHLCEKAFEWVLCCLDAASIVNSLSRCSVLSQVP